MSFTNFNLRTYTPFVSDNSLPNKNMTNVSPNLNMPTNFYYKFNHHLNINPNFQFNNNYHLNINPNFQFNNHHLNINPNFQFNNNHHLNINPNFQFNNNHHLNINPNFQFNNNHHLNINPNFQFNNNKYIHDSNSNHVVYPYLIFNDNLNKQLNQIKSRTYPIYTESNLICDNCKSTAHFYCGVCRSVLFCSHDCQTNLSHKCFK